MVSRRGDAPVLDRRISIALPVTRTVTEAVTHRFTWRAIFIPEEGEYDIGNTRRRFPEFYGPNDADGLPIPTPDAFTVGQAVTFTWDAETLTTTVLAVGNINDFGERVDDALFFELDDALDAFNTPLTLALPPTTREVTTVQAVNLWARREVLPAVDSIEISTVANLTISLARYTLRYNSRIAVGQTMTDEEGNARTVLGVQPVGRREYLDVLAEAIS